MMGAHATAAHPVFRRPPPIREVLGSLWRHGTMLKMAAVPFYQTAITNHQLWDKPLTVPVCHWEDKLFQIWTLTCRPDALRPACLGEAAICRASALLLSCRGSNNLGPRDMSSAYFAVDLPRNVDGLEREPSGFFGTLFLADFRN